MTATHNTLVISDIHLGEDMNPLAHDGAAPSMALVERQLVGFIRHYARVRHNGRPWRLVVNGDFIDFMGVQIFPGDERASEIVELHEVTQHEREYGLGRRPGVACAKMRAVVDRHEAVFRALGRFIASGNVIDIVAGNHDTELQWEPVQRELRNGIRACARIELSAERVRENVRFHDWFFYEPGVAWIEHGHSYDQNCSHEYTLAPTGADNREIATNVDGASMRYVINRNKDADHGQEDWSLAGYLTWARQLGLRGTLRLAHSYGMFCARVLTAWRDLRHIDPKDDPRRDEHQRKLAALSEQNAIPHKNLADIDEMHKRPVVTNFWRLAGVLMIDKLLIYGAAMLLSVLLFLLLPWTWAALGTSLAAGGAWLTGRWLNRGRFVDPTVPLLIVPERIVTKVDARYVIFGHTHDPLSLALDGGSTYINTGTWFPTEKPGLLRSFTHVVLTHPESGPRAALCQWRDGHSREFMVDAGIAPLADESLEMASVGAREYAR